MERKKEELDAIEKEATELNKRAMADISSNNAKTLLSKARDLIESNEHQLDQYKYALLLSVTLNNQACFYKKYFSFFLYSKGKYNAALTFLFRALGEAEKLDIPDEIEYACTLLNICAILSFLKK